MTIFMIIPIVALSMTFTQSLSGYGEEIGSLVKLKSSYYFYDSVNQDLLRAGEIIGERSTLAALSWVVEEGEGLNSSQGALYELFENGTINGTGVPIMNRSTVYDWLDTAQDISENRGYRLNLSLDGFSPEDIELSDSYTLAFGLNYSLKLSDKRGELFALEKELSKTAQVPVTGIEDPLITLGTGGKLVYRIKKTPFSYFTEKGADGRGNNSWAAGDSIVLPSNKTVIQNIDDKNEKILVTDDKVEDVMEYYKGVVIEKDVDMSDFNDPYVVDVGDISSISNNTRMVVDGDAEEVWEVQNLYSMWKNTYYSTGGGPSFLDRLENDLTNSHPGVGLNVFVRKADLQDAGLDVKDRSNLAHIYFSDDTTIDYRVKGMPDSFRMDEGHLEEFGLNNTLSYR